MVNKITFKGNCWDGPRHTVVFNIGDQLPALEMDIAEVRKVDRFLGHLKKNQRAYMAMATALALLLDPSGASAAGVSGGKNIILLLQKASFWVGMGITIWGIVEAQLDFPGWRGRILKGILGYIGILLVPLIFLTLQESLQVDVWDQIEGGKTP